jgi:hypothetical protein
VLECFGWREESMSARYLALALLIGLASGQADAEDLVVPQPLDGKYFFYSGGLGDRQPPTTNDSKLFLSVSGDAGRELFERLGAANKSGEKACQDPSTEIRRLGTLMCLRSQSSKYACYFGFDVLTGKSIRSDIC